MVQFAWEMEFSPLILARGKAYYEAGRVTQIRQMGNRVQATVIGTEAYTTEAELPEGVPQWLQCTCPYAMQANCKHMAALLFEIEAGEYTFTDEDPAPPIQLVERVEIPEQWRDAIATLPEKMVRTKLVEQAEKNGQLRLELTIRYLGHLPQGQINNWKADLQQYAMEGMNLRGYVDQGEVEALLWEAQYLLDTMIPLLLEIGTIMDAFNLTWTVCETMAEIPMEDAYHEKDRLFSNCGAYFLEIMEKASQEQKEEMRAWYQTHADTLPDETATQLKSCFC